jgi:membrane associated rhomboid family serine protease
MIPLSDDSRRPVHFPIATILIIGVNAAVFLFELAGGDVFITHWSLVPADIVMEIRITQPHPDYQVIRKE